MPLKSLNPGLVIPYSYLWADEAREGRTEGVKTRPCAVVVATANDDGRTVATVVPITHSPPGAGVVSVEIPRRVKDALRLDAARSWVVLSEANQFVWPGYDIRPVPWDGSRWDYGMLPRALFSQIVAKLLELKPKPVQREE